MIHQTPLKTKAVLDKGMPYKGVNKRKIKRDKKRKNADKSGCKNG